MITLRTVLEAIPAIGAATISNPAVRTFVDAAVATLGATDQETAKRALAAIMADNDAGHARLQEKLRG